MRVPPVFSPNYDTIRIIRGIIHILHGKKMPSINVLKRLYDELIRLQVPDVPKFVNEAVEMALKLFKEQQGEA